MATIVCSTDTGVTQYVVHANYSSAIDPYPDGATVTTAGKTLANVVNNSTITIKASETVTSSSYTTPVSVYKQGKSGWDYVDYLQSGSVSITVGTGTTYIKVGPATVKPNYHYRVKVYGRQSSVGGTSETKYYPSSSTWYTTSSSNPTFQLSNVSLTRPTGYTLFGYGFQSSPSSGESLYNTSMKMTASASGTVNNIHAVWGRYYYRIKIYPRNGGSVEYYPSETGALYILNTSPNFDLTRLTTPVRNGYKFKGWAYGSSPSEGETTYTSTMELSATSKVKDSPTVNNIHAVWTQLKGYRVKLYGNGGKTQSGALETSYYPKEAMTYTESDSVTVSISNLPAFVRSGYRLVGWADGATPTSGETVYKSYRTVYPAIGGITKEMHAVWERVYYYYRVRYYNNDGSGSSSYYPSSTTGIQTTSGSPSFSLSNIPTPTRTGYKFLGWAYGSTPASGETAYTSTMVMSASAESSADATVNNIHAVWEQLRSYRVRVYGNGGKAGSLDVAYYPKEAMTYTESSSVKINVPDLPVFTRSGYKLVGFADGSTESSGETVYKSYFTVYPIVGGITKEVHAVWERIYYFYRIKYYLNDGSGNADYRPSVGYYQDTSTTPTFQLSNLPTPTRTGYTFKGWAKGATQVAGETVYTSSITVSANDDATNPLVNAVHAVWDQQYSYRVHAYGNGGQSVHGNNDEYSPSNTEWYYTSTASPSFDLNRLPVFSRTGYNFLGWSYTSSGGTVYTDSVQLTAEKGGKVNNLYAVWQEKYKYRVHIYGNGGTTSGGATTVYTPSSTGWYISNTSSVKLVVSNVGEFKNGHKHFVGWAYGASPSAGETVYASTIELTATEDGSTNNVHIVWEDAIQPFYWLGTDAADNASIARGKTRNMTASMWSAFANRVEELGDACGASVSVSRVSVSGKMMASQYNSAVSALATIRLVLGATSVSLPSTVTANVTPITAAQFNGSNSIKGCLNRLIEVYNG